MSWAFSLALLVTAGLALWMPGPFLRWGDFPLKTMVVPLLQLILFVMGTRVSLQGLWQVLVTPGVIGLGLVGVAVFGDAAGGGGAGDGVWTGAGGGDGVCREFVEGNDVLCGGEHGVVSGHDDDLDFVGTGGNANDHASLGGSGGAGGVLGDGRVDFPDRGGAGGEWAVV